MSAPRLRVGSTPGALRSLVLGVLAAVAGTLVGCGGEPPPAREESSNAASARSQAGTGGRRMQNGRGAGAQQPSAAVPVEVSAVERRRISAYIETNGTLEAENEVDVVARISAPIVALEVEEGLEVVKNQLLARLDDRELRAQAEISRVNLAEAELAFERADSLRQSQLVSAEEYEQALTRVETARAQYESDRIQLGYTEIRAPFDGLIVARYVDLAEQVSPGMPLFRISDFTPLLCPIQVPERDLPKLRPGQRAYLTFEAWPGERFEAQVLRIRPVVEAATGTVRVTLDVAARGRLRPGMFARVFVETETRDDALVIPKAALSMESIGDTVYVVQGSTAARRSVTLGFREGDFVEVLSGVGEDEQVVVVGQDGLSDGTPIKVLAAGSSASARQAGEDRVAGEPRRAAVADRPLVPAEMTPERLESVKEMMRARGLSEEEIEERLRRGRARREQPSQ